MTRDEIEKMLKHLAETTQYLEENNRLIQAAAANIAAITARLHLRGDAGDADAQDLTNLHKLVQADIEGIREAARKPAARTHIELTEAIARLERVVLELRTDLRVIRLLNRKGGQS